MKYLKFSAIVLLSSLLLVQCKKDDNNDEMVTKGNFKVTIENVMEGKAHFSSGVFNTPVGAMNPGPATPGNSYRFTFNAGEGHNLSFATMYVFSNDLFFAPSGAGISLYEGGQPISGDITSQVRLWDAGTEVNEEPGAGPNQPVNQSGPDTGPDENGTVREISEVNDGFTYPAVGNTIRVTISNDGATTFSVTIENLAGSSTPLAPGAWVVHTEEDPLFGHGMPDFGSGLEALAEDGNAVTLGDHLAMQSGLVSPLAPGVWAVHDANISPFFEEGSTDFGEGLEALAEDGDPSGLAGALGGKSGVSSSGVFNTPTGNSSPGPLFPGSSYEFTFEAERGDRLSFATMFVQSNDLFYAPGQSGIELFNSNGPMSGDITMYLDLWDAGTEVNEYPGAGIHQPPRNNGGPSENGLVMKVDDAFSYPATNNVLRVTISAY